MDVGFREAYLKSGVTLRIRVDADHSVDCSSLHDTRGVMWVEDGERWLDRRGGNRSHNRRWHVFCCNGISSKKHGDEKQYCKARVLVEGFGLSDALNSALKY